MKLLALLTSPVSFVPVQERTGIIVCQVFVMSEVQPPSVRLREQQGGYARKLVSAPTLR